MSFGNLSDSDVANGFAAPTSFSLYAFEVPTSLGGANNADLDRRERCCPRFFHPCVRLQGGDRKQRRVREKRRPITDGGYEYGLDRQSRLPRFQSRQASDFWALAS